MPTQAAEAAKAARDVARSDAGTETDSAAAPKRPRWKRVLKRIVIGLGVTVVLVVAAGALLYEFGGMSGSVYPDMKPRYEQMVAAGQAAPIQARFVVPIPGCQCHSTAPVLTAQHSRRRMSECDKCHDTSPAHMEPGVL